MRQLVGSILVIIAAICFGFMGLFRSWAGGVSVEMTLFLRFAIAGIIMAMIMPTRRLPWPRGRLLLGLIGMGAVLYVGESMFFFHGMRHIPVGLVSLLLYVYPVLVTIFAWLFLHERLTHARIIALGLAAAGLVLTTVPIITSDQKSQLADANPILGIALGLGCCVSYSIYILVGGVMTRRAGAIPASTVVILSAAAVFGALAFAKGDAFPSGASAWIGVFSLAIVSTVIAITGVLFGLDRIGPVQTSTLSTVEPVMTVIVGAAFMNQQLNWLQIGGGLLIVGAAIIIARSSVKSAGAAASASVEIAPVH